jgi:hypothetical protein
MECPKCGMNVGNAQVHPEAQCQKQQEVNRVNLGTPCPWCGGLANHKQGCPRRRDEKDPAGAEVLTRRR